MTEPEQGQPIVITAETAGSPLSFAIQHRRVTMHLVADHELTAPDEQLGRPRLVRRFAVRPRRPTTVTNRLSAATSN